jgi:hypothetical protein
MSSLGRRHIEAGGWASQGRHEASTDIPHMVHCNLQMGYETRYMAGVRRLSLTRGAEVRNTSPRQLQMGIRPQLAYSFPIDIQIHTSQQHLFFSNRRDTTMAYLFHQNQLPKLVSVTPGRERIFFVSNELADTDAMLAGIIRYKKGTASPPSLPRELRAFSFLSRRRRNRKDRRGRDAHIAVHPCVHPRRR